MIETEKRGPGLKQSEITKCIGCGQGVMHGNQLTFYRFHVDYMFADMGAIRRQSGLEQMLGGDAAAGIAAVMGPNEDLAHQVNEHREPVLCCLSCAMGMTLAELSEKIDS